MKSKLAFTFSLFAFSLSMKVIYNTESLALCATFTLMALASAFVVITAMDNLFSWKGDK